MFGLVFQWYMVVFITLSMHTIKANFLTSVFELLREYCLTNRVKYSFITLTLQYENDMILSLIHLKKKLFKGQGGNPSPRKCLKKNRIIKHSTQVKGAGGLKV